VQPRSQELLTDAAREAAPALVAEVLRRFGRVRLRAYGGSMSPAIRPGDLLNVRRTPAEGVRRGDVVLFWRGGRLFAHRVVARTPGGMVTTRGDAHWHDDPAVPAEDVLGIVQSVLRKDKMYPPVAPVRSPSRYWKVLHTLGSPLFSPRVNHSWRCCEVPWVKRSGATRPDCMR